MKSIQERVPNARLVILSSYNTQEDVYRAIEAGAQGYVLREAPVQDIIASVRAVAGGGIWIPNEEMDRVFQEFGLERDGENKVGWTPAIEVVEKDGKLDIRAELPGLSSDDVKIEKTNEALTIQCERKVKHEENQGGVRRSERQYGFFYRGIPLPEGADVEHANAKFENGMLKISVPVSQQKESRRSIPIEAQSKPPEARPEAGRLTGRSLPPREATASAPWY